MTVWTDYLAREGALFDLPSDASGTPIPAGLRFADPLAEARAAAEGTVAVPLLHLGLLHSRGPDSAPFLHNLLSSDVAGLDSSGAQWSSLNTPKGRMLASLLLWPEAEGHTLAAAAGLLPALQKKLSMYVLRSRVKLTADNGGTALIGVAGGEAARITAAAGLPLPDAPMRQHAAADGRRVLRLNDTMFIVATTDTDAPACHATLIAAGAARAGTGAWQLAMIRAGLPLVTAATQEEFVAQMLNYELIGGVSFKKGCYPGQEIVARTQYLGKLKRRMYRIAGDSDDNGALPTPGTDLYAPDMDGQSAGKLVNIATAPGGGFEALAVIRSSSVEAGDVRLGAPDGARMRILDLPYPLP